MSLCAAACASGPSASAPRLEVELARRTRRPFLDPERYPDEAVVHVPEGCRLVAAGQVSDPALKDYFAAEVWRRFEEGTAVEFWIWYSQDRARVSFDGARFEYDLGRREDRLAVIARAYDL